MAGQCGEVVTVQLGHYANYVGAQWWNLQEAEFSQNSEVCSDVLFRRGVTLNGAETYTPRLIALDLKGSLRSLKEEGSLYEEQDTRTSAPAWTGNVSVHREEPGPSEVYTDSTAHGPETDAVRTAPPWGRAEKTLDTEETGWSDVLQTRLHPKSLCIVNSHVGDGLEAFSQGEAIYKTQLEDIEDRLHFFTEECDYLQGFQVLCDVHNGFSGVGAKMVELFNDEYPGRGILSFGTCPAPAGEADPYKAVYQLMNCVLALGPFSNYSSLFCPLSLMSGLSRRPGPSPVFPQLLYNAAAQYHSSAVLAVALNTVTIPYRMSSPGPSLSQFAEALTFGGRKMLSAVCSVPFPLAPAMSLPDALLPHLRSAPWCSVSPCPAAPTVFSQSVVLRGVPEPLHTSDLPAGKPPPSCLHSCESGGQVLQRYLDTLYPHSSLSIAHLLAAPCTLGPSFPQFFSPYLTQDGFTSEVPQAKPRVVGHIPVLGALQTSSALHHMLRALCDEVSKMNVRQWLNFSAAAVEQDDFGEAVNDVRSLAHCYRLREGEETDDSD